MALPREHRLRRRQDFDPVYQKGARCRSRHLTLRALRHRSLAFRAPSSSSRSSLQPTRIGISISQKVSKRAVDRNRIKRQLRVAIRQFLPHFSEGWDLVIVVHPQAIQCDYFEFLQELKQLLIDAEVFNGHS